MNNCGNGFYAVYAKSRPGLMKSEEIAYLYIFKRKVLARPVRFIWNLFHGWINERSPVP
jgi:hypothetical protein